MTSEDWFAFAFFPIASFAFIWAIYWVIRSLFRNLKKQIAFMWLGISLIIFMVIFPPLRYYDGDPCGYGILFTTDSPVDINRLVIQIFGVVLVIGGLMITFKNKKQKDGDI